MIEALIHWVLANKTWLFSGIGVAIVGAVLTLLFRRRVPATTENISAVEATSMIGSPVAVGSNISQSVSIALTPVRSVHHQDEYSAKPTPIEISSELSRLPVLLRRDAAKAYVGIKVRWSVSLSEIQPRGTYMSTNDICTHEVELAYYGDSHQVVVIFARVDISRFPRLRVAHAGTLMEVRGTIAEVKSASISLEDADLSFVD